MRMMSSLIGSPRRRPLPLRSADRLRHLGLERGLKRRIHPHTMTLHLIGEFAKRSERDQRPI